MQDKEKATQKPIDLKENAGSISPANIDWLFKYYTGTQLQPIIDLLNQDQFFVRTTYSKDFARVLNFDTSNPTELADNLKFLRKDRQRVITAALKYPFDAQKREIARRYLQEIGELIELTKHRLKSAKSRAKSE